MKYILASSSPRRKKLLSGFDINVECVEHLFDETSIFLNNSPEEYCQNISKGKANSVSNIYKESIIISADTIVLLDNTVLEKPKNKLESVRRLGKYFLTCIYSINCLLAVNYEKYDDLHLQLQA